ncbi:hypothetical protein Baya_12915 [Bagarius yarrelli]|uniref:Uncharacterized protein n=1 Tax=Bagarius yarrelli TaxID=175774 RepID=A0A556V4T0_BAGYA|nr:hypothetical protein Baya_12915 [Bagarius yarrelli]
MQLELPKENISKTRFFGHARARFMLVHVKRSVPPCEVLKKRVVLNGQLHCASLPASPNHVAPQGCLV